MFGCGECNFINHHPYTTKNEEELNYFVLLHLNSWINMLNNLYLKSLYFY
jgi:hypothetical protein